MRLLGGGYYEWGRIEMGEIATHQNLERARHASRAHSFMRYTLGLASASVGEWRPTTWY
jgi:hypothetical protein